MTVAPYVPRPVDEHEVLRRRLTHFRVRHDALTVERDAHEAKVAQLASELESLAKAHDETRRILCSETERAQQAEVDRGRAQAESVTLQERAMQAEAGTEALNEELDIIKERLRVLQGEHAVLQGSLRRFLRAYLPRLRRHLLGQRP